MELTYEKEIVYKKKTNLRSLFNDIFVMAKRDLLKIKHSPDKLMDVTLMPILFMVMFTFLFGGAISGDVASYLPIIVPGILVQTLVSSSSATGTQLREDMDTGVFDRFKSLPIARIAPLAGLVLSDVLRYVIATFFSIGTGYLIGWRPEAGFGWLLVACVLSIFAAWAISWIFALVGLMVRSAATISGLSMMITMVLSFLSSAFVPIKTLPTWLQGIANVNPVTHLVDAFKDLANHGHLSMNVLATLVISCVIVAIIAPITVKIYSKKI
ncbi:ABC transporter permease [Listeria booriae]|uniref:ABC transporter permease n=1 Tax=Listeria booriae TaxID=1552123 RepID=UPI00162A9A65|nr:ABC transporter permease [Listeria booriae]MBC2316687.1 ABC transporter permease [Listeria booriae]MDT0110831.1 ABC transporter permease [Listeria booriae]